MNVLLLGGGGLIGTPVARALRDAGHEVAVITKSGGELAPGIEGMRADRRDGASLERVLAGRRFDFTVDFLAYDARDVEQLLLVPHTALGRTVMISTGQVYLVTDLPRPPFREEDAERPLMPEPPAGTRAHANWTYGMGKRRAEAALLALRRSHGVRTIALRLPVVLGDGDRTGRLWEYVARLRDGGPLLIPGSLEQPLRFVWAEDVARAIVRLAAGWPEKGFAFNLAQADELTIRTFLVQLSNALGRPARVVTCTLDELTPAGLDHDVSPFVGPWCSVPDPTFAMESWGYQATAFSDYIRAVIAGLDARASDQAPWGYPKRATELEWVRGRAVSDLS